MCVTSSINPNSLYVRPFGSFGTLSSGLGVTAGVFGSAGLDGSNVTGFVV